jgi:hypothetical protein
MGGSELTLEDLNREIAKWKTLVDYLKQTDPGAHTHLAYDMLNSLERLRRQQFGF